MVMSGHFEEETEPEDEFHEGEEDGETVWIPKKIKSKFLSQKEIDRIHNYDKGVDYDFLETFDVRVVKHQPWQLGLFHKELKGKFVWYPRAGTLMFESAEGNISRIGYRGDYPGTKQRVTEDVYEVIKNTISQQKHL